MFISNLKIKYSKCQIFKYMIQSSLLKTTPWTAQKLIKSSFSKTRAFVQYLLGKNLPLFINKTCIPKNSTKYYPNSRLISLIFRQRQHVKQFYDGKSPFKTVNRNIFNGTTFTFGIVDVCIRNEDGYPDLLKSYFWKGGLDFMKFFQTTKDRIFKLDELRNDINKAEYIEFGDFISKGCCGAVHKSKIKDREGETIRDVAVKMLFNYDMSSNSIEILKSTIKECTPYNGTFAYSIDVPRKTLPSHPNIVKILSVFVDKFKPLKNSENLYPLAWPSAFGGFGYSKTLFVMQKLYDMSLKDYLNIHEQPSEECSLAILTQCFEAIDFLNRNQVAHRDLKLDNILVDLSENENDFPWIVITDFGLCSTSLEIPYGSDEVCKGGNQALMAPEIKTALPSKSTVLNYKKSDLWSMGTIAYEIFGANNPFYRKIGSWALDGSNYLEEDIPVFPSKITLLAQLIWKILQRNPDQRPSTWFVSAYCHLLFQYGSVQLQNLLQLNDSALQNKVLKKWFKLLSYKTVYEILNEPLTCSSSNFYKLRIIFLSKYNSDHLIKFLDEARIFKY